MADDVTVESLSRTIVRCRGFSHADALRIMLETDGFPAVAAEVDDRVSRGASSIVATFSVSGYAEALSPIAEDYASLSDGLATLREEAEGRATRPTPVSIAAETRDDLRRDLAAYVAATHHLVLRVIPPGPGREPLVTIRA